MVVRVMIGLGCVRGKEAAAALVTALRCTSSAPILSAKERTCMMISKLNKADSYRLLVIWYSYIEARSKCTIQAGPKPN